MLIVLSLLLVMVKIRITDFQDTIDQIDVIAYGVANSSGFSITDDALVNTIIDFDGAGAGTESSDFVGCVGC